MLSLIRKWLPRRLRDPQLVPDALWTQAIAPYPFLQALEPSEQQQLKILCTHFLDEKEFFPANGLAFDDGMALSIAAQACLPLLHMRSPNGKSVDHPSERLAWYDDFVSIVVQPGAVLAKRKVIDGAGVVHHYNEVLAGEAMDRGPVMLSWDAVAHTSDFGDDGTNVVIHEFVHKMDMRNQRLGNEPDGAPPLPKGFLGTHSAEQALHLWRETMQAAFEGFREAVAMAERFGGEKPWLDDYAATHPAEFFAVTCEAYFVSRGRFGQAFPTLLPLYDGFFRPA